jgi:signal transduction histidine kinase/ligand-binding sensor domain-containing protein
MLAAIPLCAQQEYRFERISSDDGLSQSAVTSILQDKYGYLWVGTLDGLNRYDGAVFKTYHSHHGDTTSLPKNDIVNLFLDHKEQLWITTDGFLSQYQPENDHFINYELQGKDSLSNPYFIRHVFPVSADTLILSTQAGLLWFNLKNGHHGDYSKGDKIKRSSVFGYFRTNTGYEIIITDGFTVRSKRVSQPSWKLLLLHESPIKGTMVGDAGLLVQTRDGLYKYDVGRDQLELLSSLISDNSFNGYKQGVMKRSNGDVWVMHGIIDIFDYSFKLKTRLIPIDNNPQSIGEYLSVLFESKDGVVWVGSNGLGLQKYNPLLSVFNYIGKFQGSAFTLNHEFVTSVYTSDDNIVYVGTLRGLDVIDLAMNKSSHFERTGKNGRKIRITRIVKGKDGKLWVGTSEGVMTFDGKSLQPGIAGVDSYVDDLAVDEKGSLIIASQHDVTQYNPFTRKVKILIPRGTLTVKKIKDVYWIESEGKLMLFKEGNEQPYKIYKYVESQPGSFPNTLTKCFHEDREGKIWIGTSGEGLLLFDSASETFKQFTVDDGLPNNIVYGIVEDDKGILWLSTNNGICAFNKSTGKAIRNFFKEDGLQGNEFNTGAYFQSPSGKLFFGGITGLSSFRPQDALAIKYPLPKTVVKTFNINHQRVDKLANGQDVKQIVSNSSLSLSYNERNFGVEVMGLGFTSPSRTKYKYRLENFINEWVNLGNENDITFTNIPEGDYVLQVKSSNAFGEWEEEGLKIYLTVVAPFWYRKDVLAVAILLLLLGLYAFYWVRERNNKLQKARLERMVHERTRKLQELYDEIASQNEEISAQNEELSLQAEAIELRNIELQNIRNSLEERVAERTLSLAKLNQELVDHNNQLEQFSFITAHNLRGPVARVRGLLSILEKEYEGDILNHLNASVENLDSVIMDLNLVLSIRRGNGTPLEPIHLLPEIQSASQTLHSDLVDASVTLQINCAEDVVVYGLKPYLYSIFYNLIHNAIKYRSNTRKPVITCSCSVDEKQVKIIFSDNGIGIDMRYASDKVFKLYQRFNTNTPGKGFGLFLVKTQVEAMKGTISIDSNINEGTTFTILFPSQLV